MNEFSIKPRVFFGIDALDQLKKIKGKRALIITDKVMVKLGMVEKVSDFLKNNNIECFIYDDVTPDPDITNLMPGITLMDEKHPDVLVALGGGSVIDAAKAILFSLWHSRPSSSRVKPFFIAIPTTSGTGSEVTSFAVIKSKQEKLVIIDEFMLPDIAILTPLLLTSIPATITADTGLDVLCHALEAYVSIKATDFTDALAEKAVKLVFSNLVECYAHGSDLIVREKMHNASCLAGMAFTNASLGITHSLAHALGGVFSIPHGRANALLLTNVVEFNADFNGKCNNVAATKYAELARQLNLPSSNTYQGVSSLLVAIKVLKEELNIPNNIKETGVDTNDFKNKLPILIEQALKDSCTPTNPRTVCAMQMETLYCNAFNGCK